MYIKLFNSLATETDFFKYLTYGGLSFDVILNCRTNDPACMGDYFWVWGGK